jgi:hypothetical protein
VARKELSLFYPLKGLDAAFADQLAAKLAENPDAMLKVLATEELGGTEAGGSAVQSAVAAGVSTFIGAMVPVIPLFFLRGNSGAGGSDRVPDRALPRRRGEVTVHAAHLVVSGPGDDPGRSHRRRRNVCFGSPSQSLRRLR